MQLCKINIIKEQRTLLMLPVRASMECWKRKKGEQYGYYSFVHFWIPWRIFTNVKISHLSAFNSGYGVYSTGANHKGIKSHNPSIQAENLNLLPP